MKVGFTGTQNGMTDKQKEIVQTFLDSTQIEEFHHGDCVGADADAHAIAFGLEIPVVIHPPIKSGKRAYCAGAYEIRPILGYLERNKRIVSETDVLLATPKSPIEELRSGTWSTIRFAKLLGRTVWIILPNGEILSNAPE